MAATSPLGNSKRRAKTYAVRADGTFETSSDGRLIPKSLGKGRVTKDDGYSYAFGDDPLQAQGSNAGGAQIAVRQGHVRGLLIRPRIQFVDALLKSVENI